MTEAEAREILGIGAGVNFDERFAAYEGQRAKLEARLGRAPTPGLKAKYRSALERLTAAYEFLEVEEDGGELPSLRPAALAPVSIPLPAQLQLPEQGEPAACPIPPQPKVRQKKSAAAENQAGGRWWKRRAMSFMVLGAVLLLGMVAAGVWKAREREQEAARDRVDISVQQIGEALADHVWERALVEPTVSVPGHEPSAANSDVVMLDSSYALGFGSGQEFLDKYGNYGFTAGDLDSVIFISGFNAALEGAEPDIEETRLQEALDALAQVLQDREEFAATANHGDDKRSTGKIDPIMKSDYSYGLGYLMGGDFTNKWTPVGLTDKDLVKDAFFSAFMAALNQETPGIGEPRLQAAMEALEDMIEHREKTIAKFNLEAGEKFLKENGKRRSVVTTASGLQYEVLRRGGHQKYVAPENGEPEKQFLVDYRGTLIDGTEFDASMPSEPTPITLGVIEGLKEALMMMPVGSKWKLFIPAELAYGEERRGPLIGPNSNLIFELELNAIKDAPAGPLGD